MSRQQSDSDETTALYHEIRSMLRLADATSMAGSLGRFVMGIGVCIGMGVVVASIITACLVAIANTSLVGWTGWFLVYLVVLVPWLIWHERRSREDYLTEAVRGIDPSPSSRGEYELNRAGLAVGAYASLLVWGPRALVDGLRGLRGHRSLTQEAVFDRATGLVLDLAQVDGGVPIKELLIPPENMQVFASAVDILDRHDFIGKSTDGRSLWLNSRYRQKLMERKMKLSQGGDA